MTAKLSIGKVRGLQQIANSDGIMVICAMDHRESLRSMLNKEHPERVTDQEMVQRKLELCSALAPYASAVLLDPIYGSAQCIARNILPGRTGLLVSIEASGYTGDKQKRISSILPGWSVEKIKRMGGSAVKILLYYRPDLPQIVAQQLNTVRIVAEDCIKYDIPFLVETKSYPVEAELQDAALFARRKPDLVMETARQITALPIDVLKTEFPAEPPYDKDEKKLRELCHRLDEASRTPWVILSAGVDYETFSHQVKIACKAGASGFLGGRAIWQEAMHIEDTPERVKFLSTTVRDRLKRLIDIATKYATPWYRKLSISPQELLPVSPNWYEVY